jgi:5,6-dimethylbenzimidazole synthase
MTGFDDRFRADLDRLMRWRRDVRRFRTDPLPDGLLDRLMAAAASAPSVGLSEPWRFVSVESAAARAAILSNFEAENAAALADYDADDAARYAGLKLAGLREAPMQLAAFCAESSTQGRGRGARPQPQKRRDSVVCAVMQLWLAARAEGVGVGWVSILDPEAARRALGAPEGWKLVAYLCIGWPEEEHADAELDRLGWERRRGAAGKVLRA